MGIYKPRREKRLVQFFEKQFNAYNFRTQFGAVICGVQSGKTFLGANWVGKKMAEFPGKSGCIIAPTYKLLTQSTLPKFFEIWPELRQYYNQGRSEINLPSGGTIYVRSADNPFGLEGMTLHYWWLDEGGMTSSLTWTILRSRVSMTEGQGLITTTPYNLGWLYRDFFLPWQSGQDKSLSVFTWKSIENPLFPKVSYEAERKRLRPEEFARRYQGEFRKMSGLVYELSEDQIIDPIDIIGKSSGRVIGVDWAYADPAAVITCYLVGDVWYIVSEWKRDKRTTEEIRQVIKNEMAVHKARWVYPDPAEPDRCEECRRDGIPVMEATKDVKGGISYIQQLIREKRFYVFNTCSEILNEISMYHYEEPKDGKEVKDVPEKENDHLADAMRYCIYSYKNTNINMAQMVATPAYRPPYLDQLGGSNPSVVPYEPPGSPKNPPSIFGPAPRVW